MSLIRASDTAHSKSPRSDVMIAQVANHTTVLFSESPSNRVARRNSTTAESENVTPRSATTAGSSVMVSKSGRRTVIHNTNHAPRERIEASASTPTGSLPMRRCTTTSRPMMSVA